MRTESMAQRLSKQPMSEGFVLMDKGYNLGAMRLLTFKAENSPPFQLGPCLEAIATILLRMEEAADAQENFGYAAEKYTLISQPVLAEVMTIRGVEATKGTEEALKLAEDLITKVDGDGNALNLPEGKQKQNIARAYHLRADLRMQIGQIEGAIADAQIAAAIGWDRAFEAHYTLGLLHMHKGDDNAAQNALSQAITLNQNYLPAYEALVEVLERLGDGAREQLLATVSKAIELHPRAQLIRTKAFALSESGKDAEALQMLDDYVAKPPHEETEALFSAAGAAEAVFLKAKAAIYGDQGKIADAINAVETALQKLPGDEEATAMLKDLKELQSKTQQ
jgi:tetratricopeptide (TPR) repeat protein